MISFPNHTAYGTSHVDQNHRIRNDINDKLAAMRNESVISNAAPPKTALWEAVTKLMEKHYGKENLNRLARDTHIGNGTASRMKERETSVGLDTLEKIAKFFGVEPWQLLVQGFDPASPPALSTGSTMARDVGAMLDEIKDDAQRRRAYALILQVVEFGGAPAAATVPSPAPDAPAKSSQPLAR